MKMRSGLLVHARPSFQVSLSITNLENVKSFLMVVVRAPIIASNQRKIVRVNVLGDIQLLVKFIDSLGSILVRSVCPDIVNACSDTYGRETLNVITVEIHRLDQ